MTHVLDQEQLSANAAFWQDRTRSMTRLVMLGGAPGIGKSAVARALLQQATDGSKLVQWVDVDSLWLHQPWRVDDQMRTMVQENLRAVFAHSVAAKIDVLIVTWVFQSSDFHTLVASLAPKGVEVVSVQLRAQPENWRTRFTQDLNRPQINEFFEARYESAQSTPADKTIDTDYLNPTEVAQLVAISVDL
ncbi:DEAD/DEAH box helicase family protein [Arthrobacter tecti]